MTIGMFDALNSVNELCFKTA